MKRIAAALPWVVLLAVSASTRADSDNGLYLGLGIHEAEVSNSQIDDSARSGHIALGYRFNRFMATEVGIYNLGDFSQTAIVGPAVAKAEYSGWVTGIALVPRLPIGIFDLYARGGVQYYDVKADVVTTLGGMKDDETGIDVYGSLGASVNIGRHWSVYLEYSIIYASDRVDTRGLGFRYHF